MNLDCTGWLRSAAVVLCSSISTLGCVGLDQESGGDVAGEAEAEQPIIDGDFSPITNSGAISFGWCSGTLITNEWILTAGHCFADDNLIANPSLVNNIVYGAQVRTADLIIRHPDWGTPGVWFDVALVRVSTPFSHAGSTESRRLGMYAGSMTDLVAKTLLCKGYGQTTYTGGGGAADLRQALLVPGDASAQGYRLYPNALGQIQWLGDSGGSCELELSGGGELLTGVQSSCTSIPSTGTVTSCWQFGGADARKWILDHMFAAIRLPMTWERPLPNNALRFRNWDPCNGGCFNWTAKYQFETGFDFGTVGGTSLTGTGTSSGSFCGADQVNASTDFSVQSTGFDYVQAQCTSGLQCFGPECFTQPSPILNNSHLATSWTPCYGQCFTWTATYDLESGFDFASVNGISLTGAGAWTASACGTIPVSVTTDFSVLSNGLRLRASCSP